MRDRQSLIAACACVLSIAAPASAATAPVAQATGKWLVEFENERCTAARAYSDGINEFAVGFQPWPTSRSMDVIVQVPKAVDRLAEWNVRMSIGAGERIDAAALATATSKPGQSRFDVEVDRNEVGRLLQNPDLRIDTDQGPRVHVQLADFPAVMKMLNDCEAGLLATWGLSKEAQATLRSFPKPKAAITAYFTAEDFPGKALDRGEIGLISARVTVKTDGTSVDCHIMQTSGHKDLDQSTCEIFVRRVRFEPARDRSGSAVSSPYVFKVDWLALL